MKIIDVKAVIIGVLLTTAVFFGVGCGGGDTKGGEAKGGDTKGEEAKTNPPKPLWASFRPVRGGVDEYDVEIFLKKRGFSIEGFTDDDWDKFKALLPNAIKKFERATAVHGFGSPEVKEAKQNLERLRDQLRGLATEWNKNIHKSDPVLRITQTSISTSEYDKAMDEWYKNLVVCLHCESDLVNKGARKCAACGSAQRE